MKSNSSQIQYTVTEFEPYSDSPAIVTTVTVKDQIKSAIENRILGLIDQAEKVGDFELAKTYRERLSKL